MNEDQRAKELTPKISVKMSCVCSCPPKRFVCVLRPGRLFLDVFFRLCPSVLTCRDNHEFENMKYLFQWWDIMNQVDMGHRPWEKVPGGTQLGQTRGGRSTLSVPKWDFSWMVWCVFQTKTLLICSWKSISVDKYFVSRVCEVWISFFDLCCFRTFWEWTLSSSHEVLNA